MDIIPANTAWNKAFAGIEAEKYQHVANVQ